jgi:hypothetical protein
MRGHEDPVPRARRPSAAALGRTREAEAGAAPELTRLQRSAGNHAVATLLATQGLVSRKPRDAPSRGSTRGKPSDVAKANEQDAPRASEPESYWTGEVKGWLGEHPVAYHTLNNYGDTPLQYTLRVKNTGYCLVDLETRYEYHRDPTSEERAWVAVWAQRGKTEETTNGLPPHSSLHLRLFGERDATRPGQAYIEGTAEVIRKK